MVLSWVSQVPSQGQTHHIHVPLSWERAAVSYQMMCKQSLGALSALKEFFK